MALPWVDFVWTIKRWLSLYPLDAISNLPISIKTADYVILDTDYYLVANSTSPLTFTMPSAADSTGRVLKFKNRGTSNLTVVGTVFSTQVITSVTLITGDMATLTSDGTYWNVGD